MAGFEYLVVEIQNNGRKVLENGVLANSHTKKSDMNALPRNMWNAKGKKMMEAAKGSILNDYGKKGWELISVIPGIDESGVCNKYIFKQYRT